MQNDLISRSELLGKLRFAEEHGNGFGLAFPIELVEVAPTVDAVEVVRCKDCKWLYNKVDMYCCTRHTGLVLIKRDGSSFCSCGERRPDNV